jgi:crossover junction endodeoxyribonuclease RuvC
MIILGIDPGFERLGISIIKKNKGQKEELVFSECFKTSKTLEFTERLKLIGENLEKLILKYKPQFLGIENLYIETNQKTAMRVSEVRGVILYIAKKNNLKIYEYTPLQVKSAVTGYGKADKKSVMMMVPKLIQITGNKKMIDDELDAIAVALTLCAYEHL